MRWKAVTFSDNMLWEDNFDRCLFYSSPPPCSSLIAALTVCQGILFLRLLSDSVPGDIISEVLVKDGCFTEKNVAAVGKEKT